MVVVQSSTYVLKYITAGVVEFNIAAPIRIGRSKHKGLLQYTVNFLDILLCPWFRRFRFRRQANIRSFWWFGRVRLLVPTMSFHAQEVYRHIIRKFLFQWEMSFKKFHLSFYKIPWILQDIFSYVGSHTSTEYLTMCERFNLRFKN